MDDGFPFITREQFREACAEPLPWVEAAANEAGGILEAAGFSLSDDKRDYFAFRLVCEAARVMGLLDAFRCILAPAGEDPEPSRKLAVEWLALLRGVQPLVLRLADVEEDPDRRAVLLGVLEDARLRLHSRATVLVLGPALPSDLN